MGAYKTLDFDKLPFLELGLKLVFRGSLPLLDNSRFKSRFKFILTAIPCNEIIACFSRQAFDARGQRVVGIDVRIFRATSLRQSL